MMRSWQSLQFEPIRSSTISPSSEILPTIYLEFLDFDRRKQRISSGNMALSTGYMRTSMRSLKNSVLLLQNRKREHTSPAHSRRSIRTSISCRTFLSPLFDRMNSVHLQSWGFSRSSSSILSFRHVSRKRNRRSNRPQSLIFFTLENSSRSKKIYKSDRVRRLYCLLYEVDLRLIHSFSHMQGSSIVST